MTKWPATSPNPHIKKPRSATKTVTNNPSLTPHIFALAVTKTEGDALPVAVVGVDSVASALGRVGAPVPSALDGVGTSVV